MDYRQNRAWQRRDGLAVCRATRGFPQAERLGWTKQMREAAAAVNVAGGYDLLHFLDQARASPNEVEDFIHLARCLDYLDEAGQISFSGP